MIQPTPQLKSAPIAEAVLDIECDFAPGAALASLQGPARDAFRGRYPKWRMQLMQEFQFEATDQGSTHQPVQQAVRAFQFLTDDERQLVQVRSSGYSFNRLKPYTSLDDYLPEIKRTWGLYCGLASPIQVRKMQLRYINRIYLPMTAGRVQLDDFLKLGPKLPDEDNMTLVGFLNQYMAVENETGHMATVVLTTEAIRDGQLPLIFDNSVSANLAADPGDWEFLSATLTALRDLKNRVFVNTLSERCLNLFQQ